MTEDKDFKRLVRERAAKTGESYRAAREQFRPTTRPTGFFVSEPFIELLALANDEARIANHANILPEHLLLAILDGGGGAVDLLRAARVNPVALRRALNTRLATAAGELGETKFDGAWVRPGAEPVNRPNPLAIRALLTEAQVRHVGVTADAGVSLLLALVDLSDDCRSALAANGGSAERLHAAAADIAPHL